MEEGDFLNSVVVLLTTIVALGHFLELAAPLVRVKTRIKILHLLEIKAQMVLTKMDKEVCLEGRVPIQTLGQTLVRLLKLLEQLLINSNKQL
jgi:hypothetical protein